MNKCIEYEKYFFDYIDNVLSSEKHQKYEAHIALCTICGAALKQHKKYSLLITQKKEAETTPNEYSLRLQAKLKSFILASRKDSLLDDLGLISLEQIGETFSLNLYQMDELRKCREVIRLNKDYYIKKEDIISILQHISTETRQRVRMDINNPAFIMRQHIKDLQEMHILENINNN